MTAAPSRRAAGLRRTFIAASVPASVREVYRDFREATEFSRGWRWVAPENLHLTLRFLGAASPERLDSLRSFLHDALATVDPFTVTLGRGGSFGSRRIPTVLWVGLDGGRDAFQRLTRIVSETVESVGFEPERKSGTAHLTLARNARRRPLETWPEDGTAEAFCGHEFRVREATLYASELRATGPVYTEIWSEPLGERSRS